jgi:hypothetical protein
VKWSCLLLYPAHLFAGISAAKGIAMPVSDFGASPALQPPADPPDSYSIKQELPGRLQSG